MNREDYLAEGYRHLSDTKFYRKKDADLTNDHNAKVKALADRLFDKGEITDRITQYMVVEEPRTAQFYLLPKIHKRLENPPGRPIVSANDCPTERISEIADFF